MECATREFGLKFDMDNEAFAEDAPGEIARILRDIAGKVEAGRTDGVIHDANGNSVGNWFAELED